MAINYGILQSPMGPGIQTQVIQQPNTSQANEQGLLSGINSMNDSQRTASELQSQAAVRDRMQKLLPGELAQQQATLGETKARTQGQGLLNQKSQIELMNDKQTQAYHQADLDAFQNASKVGGTDAGLDAMGKSMASHDAKGYLELQKTRQELTNTIATGNVNRLTDTGSLLHGVVDQSGQMSQQKDPKTGQPMVVTPLQLYSQQYDVFKQVNPNAPKPETFKNNEQFMSSYVVPTMSIALPYQKQVAAEQEMRKTDEMYKSTKTIEDAQTALEHTVNTYGANSKEAAEATKNLEDAQAYKQSVIHGKTGDGIFSSIGQTIKNIGGAIVNKIENKFNTTTPSPTVKSDNAAPAVTKTIDGVTYERRPDGWHTK